MTNTQTSTTMTDTQGLSLVLKGEAGEYYQLPWETVERGRVSAERTAEIEQQIAEQQDVQGHLWPVIFAIAELASALTGPAVVATGTYLIYREATK